MDGLNEHEAPRGAVQSGSEQECGSRPAKAMAPRETPSQRQPSSNRPTYTPGLGDTSDDMISHLQADIAWLESVIRMARDDIGGGDDSSAYIVLKHSGVQDV